MNSSFAGYLGWEHRLVAPCKGIQDNPGFWIRRRGSPSPIVSGIPDVLELHSGFESPGSEFPQAKFPGFQLPLAKIFQGFRVWILLHNPSLGLLANPITVPPEWGGGGEGSCVLLGILGGGMPPGSPNPDPISDQKCNFPYPFSDLALRQKLWEYYID